MYFFKMIECQTSTGTLLMFVVEEKMGAAARGKFDAQPVVVFFCRFGCGVVPDVTGGGWFSAASVVPSTVREAVSRPSFAAFTSIDSKSCCVCTRRAGGGVAVSCNILILELELEYRLLFFRGEENASESLHIEARDRHDDVR